MEQGLHQGCVLRPLLFNIVVVVINVVYTRFKVDEDIMNAMVHLMKKKGAGGRVEVFAGESQSWQRHFGVLH